MWYLYDENYVVLYKSKTEPEQSNKVFYDEDIDLDLFKITIGSIQDINGVPTITYITKKIKSDFELLARIKEQNVVVTAQQDKINELSSTVDFLMTDVIPSLM